MIDRAEEENYYRARVVAIYRMTGDRWFTVEYFKDTSRYYGETATILNMYEDRFPE